MPFHALGSFERLLLYNHKELYLRNRPHGQEQEEGEGYRSEVMTLSSNPRFGMTHSMF